MKNLFLIAILALSLFGCSSDGTPEPEPTNIFTDLVDETAFQDEYYESFGLIETQEILSVEKSYNPSVVRGIIETEYSYTIPSGDYISVAVSKGRVFYVAPKGFEYRKNNKVESTISSKRRAIFWY